MWFGCVFQGNLLTIGWLRSDLITNHGWFFIKIDYLCMRQLIRVGVLYVKKTLFISNSHVARRYTWLFSVAYCSVGNEFTS